MKKPLLTASRENALPIPKGEAGEIAGAVEDAIRKAVQERDDPRVFVGIVVGESTTHRTISVRMSLDHHVYLAGWEEGE